MWKGQKHMKLMNCHAAHMYLARKILISCESVSLREFTGIVVGATKRCRFRGTFCEVKSGLFKFYLFRVQNVVQISQKSRNWMSR